MKSLREFYFYENYLCSTIWNYHGFLSIYKV